MKAQNDTQEEAGCFKMRLIEYHDYKTLMGPCFVSFSIPLLIPGVTLTVVGSYGNENLFPLFGGWHITGIVILSIAVTMLFVGILLKCCFRPVLGIDVEKHLSPNPSMISGHRNLGYLDGYTGSSAVLKNKVGHHDGSHRLVSTHENSSDRVKHTDNEASAAVSKHRSSNNSNTEASNTHTATLGGKHILVASSKPVQPGASGDEDTSQQGNPQGSPSSKDSSHRKKHKRSRSGHDADGTASVTQSNTDGGIRSTVIATVDADVETSTRFTNGHLSDTAEGSSSLNESTSTKRKKKKKKRRNSSKISMSVQDESDGELLVHSRDKLPDLRSAPTNQHEAEAPHTEMANRSATGSGNQEADDMPHSVLIRDGDSHHHAENLHVHFQ